MQNQVCNQCTVPKNNMQIIACNFIFGGWHHDTIQITQWYVKHVSCVFPKWETRKHLNYHPFEASKLCTFRKMVCFASSIDRSAIYVYFLYSILLALCAIWCGFPTKRVFAHLHQNAREFNSTRMNPCETCWCSWCRKHTRKTFCSFCKVWMKQMGKYFKSLPSLAPRHAHRHTLARKLGDKIYWVVSQTFMLFGRCRAQLRVLRRSTPAKFGQHLPLVLYAFCTFLENV